ncbi:hypothetical protein ABNQ39_00140 (plasmid) [Azospirillum sp. A26]|uniref:hypothetical protein n=1 Tax=Azospirillum sp. A26 TaxID=3160607 RepID=UPI0036732554
MMSDDLQDAGMEVELPAGTETAALDQPGSADRQGTQPGRRAEDDEGLSERVQKRIGKLVAQRDRHRNAAVLEAERRANLERENAELRARLTSTVQTGLTWAEQNAQQELERATADAQTAMDSGDAAKMAEAQRRIASATVRLEQVAQAKPQQQAEQDRQPAQQHQQQPAQRQESPAMAAWRSENDWFGADRALTQAAVGHHYGAVAKGLKPETPEYFAEIDRRMRADFPDAFEDDGYAEQPAAQQSQARRPAAAGVAPVTRQAAAPAGTPGAGKVRLTADQVSIAKSLGLTPEAYAKSLVALQKKGKLA